MEKRLIDANALLEHFNALQNLLGEYCECFKNASGELSTEWHCVESIVENAPTIDAVQVVRCRECKHAREFRDGLVACLAWSRAFRCDGFCYMGAKMDGGATE